jgi:hypothetical protein
MHQTLFTMVITIIISEAQSNKKIGSYFSTNLQCNLMYFYWWRYFAITTFGHSERKKRALTGRHLDELDTQTIMFCS